MASGKWQVAVARSSNQQRTKGYKLRIPVLPVASTRVLVQTVDVVTVKVAMESEPKKMKAEASAANITGTTGSSTDGMAQSTSDLLGPNATKSQSVSASANPDTGFNNTCQHLRSILMHPIGLPLFLYLNDIPHNKDDFALKGGGTVTVNLPASMDYIWSAFENFATFCKSNPQPNEDYLRENVLTATSLDWNGGETQFTKKLLFNVNHCKIGDFGGGGDSWRKKG